MTLFSLTLVTFSQWICGLIFAELNGVFSLMTSVVLFVEGELKSTETYAGVPGEVVS